MDASETRPLPGSAGHEGTDPGPAIGLLLLRLVVGGLFIASGTEKFFGWAGTPGREGFADSLAGFGFTQPGLLATITAVVEIVAGLLLIIGLLSALAAVPLLGISVAGVVFRFEEGLFLTDTGGFAFELLLAAATAALVFSGPGRFALDNGRPYFKFPLRSAIVFLALGGIITAVVLFLFR
ncbi:putative membrane protein [Actinoalloteichus hymeniacidonis]|uniref:Membrane protein n=2 Tax=Actinoalloteichus hymeniacidonis TaxID=340345 RepID=A0AAC9HTD6_9PSEU|nr:putative membrane protein [Actinoalloteichus hymeniacidonis]